VSKWGVRVILSLSLGSPFWWAVELFFFFTFLTWAGRLCSITRWMWRKVDCEGTGATIHYHPTSRGWPGKSVVWRWMHGPVIVSASSPEFRCIPFRPGMRRRPTAYRYRHTVCHLSRRLLLLSGCRDDSCGSCLASWSAHWVGRTNRRWTSQHSVNIQRWQKFISGYASCVRWILEFLNAAVTWYPLSLSCPPVIAELSHAYACQDFCGC